VRSGGADFSSSPHPAADPAAQFAGGLTGMHTIGLYIGDAVLRAIINSSSRPICWRSTRRVLAEIVTRVTKVTDVMAEIASSSREQTIRDGAREQGDHHDGRGEAISEHARFI
jgi:hypothetical protein